MATSSPCLAGVCALCTAEIKKSLAQGSNQCDASCPRVTGITSDANEKARAVADLFCKTYTAHTKAFDRDVAPEITYKKRLRPVKAPWCACVRAKIANPKKGTADVLKRCMGCWTPPTLGVDGKVTGTKPADRFVHLPPPAAAAAAGPAGPAVVATTTGLPTPAATQDEQGDVDMTDALATTTEVDQAVSVKAAPRHAYVESYYSPIPEARARTGDTPAPGEVLSIEEMRSRVEKGKGISRETLAAREEYSRTRGDGSAPTDREVVTGEKRRLVMPEPREETPEHPMKKPKSVTPQPDTSGPRVADKGSESPPRDLHSGSTSSSSDEDDDVTHTSETMLSIFWESETEDEDEEEEGAAANHREPSLEIDEMVVTSSFSFVPDSEDGSSEIGVGLDDDDILPDDEDLESLGEYEIQDLELDLPYDFFESAEVPPLTQETEEGDDDAEPREDFEAVHPLDDLDDFIDVSLNFSIDMPEELEALLVGGDDDDDDNDEDGDLDEDVEAPAPADDAPADDAPADDAPADETHLLETLEAAEEAADVHLAHVEAAINAGDLVFEHRVKQDQARYLGERIKAWESGAEKMPLIESIKAGMIEKVIEALRQRLGPMLEVEDDLNGLLSEKMDTAYEGDVDSDENECETMAVPVADMLGLPTESKPVVDSIKPLPTISVVPPTPMTAAPISRPTAPVIDLTTPEPGDVIELSSDTPTELSTDTEDDEQGEAGGDGDGEDHGDGEDEDEYQEDEDDESTTTDETDESTTTDDGEEEGEIAEETEFEGFADDFIVIPDDEPTAEDADEPEFEGFVDIEDLEVQVEPEAAAAPAPIMVIDLSDRPDGIGAANHIPLPAAVPVAIPVAVVPVPVAVPVLTAGPAVIVISSDEEDGGVPLPTAAARDLSTESDGILEVYDVLQVLPPTPGPALMVADILVTPSPQGPQPADEM